MITSAGPRVSGGNGARFRTLALLGMLAGCAPLEGDWLQAGNGSNGSTSGWSYGSGWGASSSSGRPGWDSGYDDRYDNDRYVRTDRRTVCDRGTQTCYRKGDIDQSETRDQFGNRAGRRADEVRDRYGDDAFVRSRKVACDRGDRTCYKNGRPDRSETRDVFGKKAARKIK